MQKTFILMVIIALLSVIVVAEDFKFGLAVSNIQTSNEIRGYIFGITASYALGKNIGFRGTWQFDYGKEHLNKTALISIEGAFILPFRESFELFFSLGPARLYKVSNEDNHNYKLLRSSLGFDLKLYSNLWFSINGGLLVRREIKPNTFLGCSLSYDF